MGYVQITSRIGSALAPWVAKWLGVFHVAVPFSVMGALSIVAALLLLWLPETRNRKTIETVQDLIGDMPVRTQATLIEKKEATNAV